MVPDPAASAFVKNEKNISNIADLLDHEPWGKEAAICVSTNPPGNMDAQSSIKTTVSCCSLAHSLGSFRSLFKRALIKRLLYLK